MPRFALLILPDAPFDTLAQRWQTAEALGFDAAYVADHTGDYRDLDGYWLDGWTVLAHVASATTSIRIGTLVSNPLLRHPAQLAMQAVAVDQLSDGRLELGIGTGVAGFDHEAVGEPYWAPRERAARFAEYVEVVDGILRSPSRTFAHDGQYFRSKQPSVTPAAVQSPRPPLTLGGQSPTVLRSPRNGATAGTRTGRSAEASTRSSSSPPSRTGASTTSVPRTAGRHRLSAGRCSCSTPSTSGPRPTARPTACPT